MSYCQKYEFAHHSWVQNNDTENSQKKKHFGSILLHIALPDKKFIFYYRLWFKHSLYNIFLISVLPI